MIKVDEALKKILDSVVSIDSEFVRLTDALGRVLAQDIYSDLDIPQFDNSAMDGYALRSFDIKGAAKDRPKILEVIFDLKAGEVTKKILKDNQAIRIMTGAMIPKGADAVVRVEDTKKHGDKKVTVLEEVRAGENIRNKGEDVQEGELVISKGAYLNSAHIGILASLGIGKVKVTRKPKVAILATGDEVIDVDEKLEPGKLRSSNTYTLFSQVIKSGGIPKNLGIARDNPSQLEKKIREGLDCDLILTSGGVSVGDYDLVKYILAKMGTNIKFWQVAMRPGKPLVFGAISVTNRGGSASGKKEILVFGLPGNPVSSMICFEVFVRSAILKMLGQIEDGRKEVDAVLEEDLRKKKGIRYFLRAKTRWEDGIYLTKTTGPQGSGILKSFVLANSLIILPEEEEFVEKGRRVTVRFLD